MYIRAADIGTHYNNPSFGYGGYCLPKDTCALYSQSCAKGYEPLILKNVIDVNNNRAADIAKIIIRGLDKDAAIGILGLSFKPDSDDVRDTAAARIIRELTGLGYNTIYAYDPEAMSEFKKRYPDIMINFLDSARAVYDKCDVAAIVTAWEEFRKVPSYGNKKIIDCRYML